MTAIIAAFFARAGIPAPLCKAATWLILGALVGGLWWRGSHYRDQRDRAHADLSAQVSNWRAAYAAAAHEAQTAKQTEDARLAAIKEQADHATPPVRTDALDRAAAYAAGHRIVQLTAATDSGPAGKAGMPGAATTAGSAENSATEPELVAVSRADLDACTLNTADLRIAYEWGQKLQTDAADRTPAP